jgi:polysaccharide export outer membrane protein
LSGPIPIPGAHLDASGDHSSVELRLKDVLDPSTPESNLAMRPRDVVSVAMKPRLVYIIGEVSHPGAVELVTQDSVSVMQVLAAAGGLTKVASPGHSGIMRVNQQGLYEKFASINLKRVMSGKLEDRLLKPGDIIVVPSSNLKAYGQIAGTGAVSTGLYILTRY